MPKLLRVADIQATVVGQVEGLNGAVYDVKPLTFDTHQRLLSADESANSLADLRHCVTEVVPEMPADEVGRLTTASAQAILLLAGAGIDAVEKMFPNAVRPENSQTSPA